MRYIILFLLLSVTLLATNVKWLDDYSLAMQKANNEHKFIYVFISSPTCGWCEKFEKTTLKDESIKKRLNKEFIAVHLVRTFDDIPQKFATSPVPRHYFTDAKGNILYNSLGYRKVTTFNLFMDYVEDNFKKQEKK